MVYRFTDEIISDITTNGAMTEKLNPTRNDEANFPQRASDFDHGFDETDIQIDDVDCLPESDSKSHFVAAEDSFGRVRRVKIGTESAKRVQEREKLRQLRAENEREALAMAELRAVASYVDI